MSVFDSIKIDEFEELDYAKIEEKYRNFYAPTFVVKLEGQQALGQGMEIPEVNVTNPINEADQFSFSVNNAFDPIKKDFKWLDEFFTPGRSVEISMGYTDRLEPMLFGQIRSVKFNFPAGGLPSLEVSGLDISHGMMEGKKSESWKDVKDSDVVREIAKKYKIPNLEITATEVKYPKVEKEGQTDFQFLNDLADRNNFEFFIFGKTLYFRKKSPRKTPVVTLEWGKNLLSFAPEVNIAGQVSKVRRIGWDAAKKNKIVGEAKTVDEIGKGGKTTSIELIKEIYGRDVVEEIYCHITSQQEALMLAGADLNKRSGNLLTGGGETFGLPEIRAGRHIKLAGLGSKFSKTYYIAATTHTVSASGYQTTFNVRSNKL